jgi:cell wall-active antibiotic response 4TMS protein YvqF
MSNETKCRCARCTCSGLMGPAVLITLGALVLVGRMGWGYSFRDLWPVLLIVIGLVKLAESLSSAEGHIGA